MTRAETYELDMLRADYALLVQKLRMHTELDDAIKTLLALCKTDANTMPWYLLQDIIIAAQRVRRIRERLGIATPEPQPYGGNHE